MILVLAILLVAILILLVRCIVIVPQSNAFVVERLGVYKTTWEAGLHLKIPFIERVASKRKPPTSSPSPSSPATTSR